MRDWELLIGYKGNEYFPLPVIQYLVPNPQSHSDSPKHYERWILSFWLMKIKAAVAGMTTIAVPHTRLQRKFAKEGVIVLNLFLHSSS